MNNEHLKIQKLNDSFRTSLSGGKVMITRGISLLPPDDVKNIIKQVQNFNSFNKSNDPYGEHDFGAFDFKENRIFWKIDYYDTEYLFYSISPANEECTNRVLTIMLADEY